MKRTSHSVTAKKRKKIIAIVTVSVVVLGFLGYYVTGTPAWSLFQLYRAYKAHDVRTALKYIDVRSVLEYAADNLRTQLAMSDAQAGTAPAPSSVEAFVEALRPLLRERIENRLLSAVADSDYERASSVAELKLASKGVGLGDQVSGRMFSIDRDGSSAMLTLKNGARIGLRQTSDRYWRIVSIEGLIQLTDDEKELLRSAASQGELRERILDRIQL